MGRLYPVHQIPGALQLTGTITKPSAASMEKARRIRRSYGVHFYSGRNGTGKSALCVYDTIPDLDAGRTVLSTVRLLDAADPRPCEGFVRGDVNDPAVLIDCPVCEIDGAADHPQAHSSYVPFRTWGQLLSLRKGVCVMDEITGVADSSDSQGLPNMVGNELAQLRRAKVVLRITGLNFIRANKRIREAATAVTRCESFLPVTVDDASEDTLWRPRQLTIARTYDAKTLPLDDIKETHWEEADLIVKSRAWIPEWDAIRYYDTLAEVDRVGTVSDAGRCAFCGGTRKAHECDCHDYQHEKATRAAARPARRAAPRTRAADLVPTPLAVAQGAS